MFRILLLLISISLISLLNCDAKKHVPWELNGAKDRIEKYRKAEAPLKLFLPDGRKLPAGVLVEIELKKHEFNFGVSLAGSYSIYNEPYYPKLLEYCDQLFNYITVAFYWRGNLDRNGEWNLREHNKQPMDWARNKGKRIRGHPLIWHNVIPRRIADKERDAAEIGKDIMKHAELLLSLYPEIDEWDIYNEAPVWEGIPTLHDENLGIRRWMNLEGGPANVTEKLARLINKIQPDADGLLNHFNLEHPSYHEMIKTCLERNVPIHGIGLQSHMQDSNSVWDEKYMWNLMEEYGSYGLPIHFTEVTILSCEGVADWREMQVWEEKLQEQRRSGKKPDQQKSTKILMKRQAEYTRDFYTLAFSHPAVNTIVWWALCDKGVWRGLPGGLFDEQGRVKPVTKELNRLINQEWHTHMRGRLKVAGEVPIKGFKGSYHIKLKYEDVEYFGNFDLIENSEEYIEIQLIEKKDD